MKDTMKIANDTWEWGKRTYIMGILNVTPDLSDGGKFADEKAALDHAAEMESRGADIIDVGGESTRPGGSPVGEEEEMKRTVPVIGRLASAVHIPLSIDTYKAATAERAVEAGASMINDIWGLKKDPAMARTVASCGVPVCIMHNRTNTDYRNLMEDILSELAQSIEIALKAGVRESNIIVDPGIGFGKTWEQNLEVMKHLDELKRLGFPILLGASRKSFIGRTLDLPVGEREEGTMAVTAIGIAKGADIVRVHDVQRNVRTARMTDAMVR